MAIHGEPDAELDDLLARSSISSAPHEADPGGVIGSEIYAAADPLVRKSKQHTTCIFLGHGMAW